ncbi:hypothetical protein ACFL38_04810 [Candidatus Omnitrophota bacterium]
MLILVFGIITIVGIYVLSYALDLLCIKFFKKEMLLQRVITTFVATVVFILFPFFVPESWTKVGALFRLDNFALFGWLITVSFFGLKLNGRQFIITAFLALGLSFALTLLVVFAEGSSTSGENLGILAAALSAASFLAAPFLVWKVRMPNPFKQ